MQGVPGLDPETWSKTLYSYAQPPLAHLAAPTSATIRFVVGRTPFFTSLYLRSFLIWETRLSYNLGIYNYDAR